MIQQEIFHNSDVLFVEYHDVMKVPELSLLPFAICNPKLREIIDFSPIDILIGKENNYFDAAGLIEWYKYRKNRNIFDELKIYDTISPSDMETLLVAQITSNDRIILNSPFLDFANKIKMLLSQGMITKVIFYTPYQSNTIETDLLEYFGDSRIYYKHGNFSDVVFTLEGSITFVLSDIDKIHSLMDTGKLELSTILLADDYRYNRINLDTYKIDLIELYRKCVFKYGFFNALS